MPQYLLGSIQISFTNNVSIRSFWLSIILYIANQLPPVLYLGGGHDFLLLFRKCDHFLYKFLNF